MARRCYIVPKDGDGLTANTAFRAKYFASSGMNWSAMDFGRDDAMLVISDVTPEQHATLSTSADVVSVPADLETAITPDALAAFEEKRIPTDWVRPSHTYRDLVRFAAKLTQIWQRWDGVYGRSFYDEGVSLDSTMADIGTTRRTALETTVASMGPYGLGAVTDATTVRQFIQIVIDQMPPVALGGLVL